MVEDGRDARVVAPMTSKNMVWMVDPQALVKWQADIDRRLKAVEKKLGLA